MADNQASLAIEITGDSGSAVSAISAANAALAGSAEPIAVNQAAYDKLSVALDGILAKYGLVAPAADAAAAGATKVAVASTAAAETLKNEGGVFGQFASDAISHARSLSMAYDEMGLSAGAAGSRISALGQMFTGLGDTAPGIVVLGAALATAFAAFSFLDQGIKSAEQMQSTLSTLRGAVEAQGGSWDAASASIHRFLDAESLASGFTQGQLATALNQLVTSGRSVADSETMVAVAEETAVAKHRDVLDIVNLLIQAEAGRGLGLQKLDPEIKAIIASHGTLDDVLKQLHKDNQDQLADTSSLEGAKRREGVAWDDAAAAIGSAFLPFLTEANYEMIGAIKNAQIMGSAIGEALNGVVSTVQAAAKGLSDFAEGIAQLASHNVAGAVQSFNSAMHDGGSYMKGVTEAARGFGDVAHAAFDGASAHALGYAAVLEAIQKHQQDISTGLQHGLDNNPTFGNLPVGKGSGSVGTGAGGGRDGSGSSSVVFNPLAGVIPSIGQIQSVLNQFYANLKNNDADATDMMGADWAKFVSDSNQKLEDDMNTFNKTNSEKADYYYATLQNMLLHDTGNLEQRKNLYTQFIGAIEAEDKQRYQYEQQFENEATQHMTTFLNDIVVDHKSMASELKNVYGEILQAFDSMIAQMLMKAISAMPWFQAIFGLGGASSGLNFGGVTIPGLPFGLGSNAVGSSGAGAGSNAVGSNIASLASSPAMAGAMSLASSASGGGGSVGSGSYGSYGGGSASPMSFGAGGGFGSYGNASSSGGASGGGFTGAGYNFGPSSGGGGMLGLAGLLGRGGILGGLGMAGIGGMALGDIAFGGKGYSALGGALGGLGMAAGGALALGGAFGPALLAMMSSPIGWGLIAGAALLGAFGGSLFGDHFSQANEPDIYQNQAWGQANADMQGSTAGNPMNANGKQFVMDSQTSQATGGKGWNITFEKFVQQFRGNLKWLPADLRDAFPQIEALWGGATDKSDFNPDGSNGYLDIGSGKRALWSDFWGQITSHGQEISQLMQSMSPTEMYVASVNGGLQNIGSTTTGPSGGATGNPFSMPSPGGGSSSNAIASGGPGRVGGSLAERIGSNIQISINRSGTLMSDENMKRAIQDAVAAALPFALQDVNGR